MRNEMKKKKKERKDKRRKKPHGKKGQIVKLFEAQKK